MTCCAKRYKVFAIVILVALIVQPVSLSHITEAETKTVRFTTWFLAPAIGSSNDASLINVTITVTYPGTGKVEVEAGGAVADTTRTSTELAIYTAAIAANVDWRLYDFRVSFHINMPIEGPSASFGIALATYLLIKDGLGKLPYVITGAISPDLTDLPVGGVKLKAEAALNQGYTIFYPLANIKDLEGIENVEDGEGNTVPSTGLYNVSTFLGFDIPIVYTFNVTKLIPQAYFERLREDTGKMLMQAYGNLTEAESILGGNDTRVIATRNLLEDTESIVNTGVHPYTAASLAFRALYNATSLYYLALLQNDNVYGQLVQTLRQKIEEMSAGMNNSFSTVYSFELSSIAQARLVDANLTLERVIEGGQESMDEATIASMLGYVSARIETVKHWYQSALDLNATPPYLPSSTMIESALLAYLEYTGKATEYILAILHETLGDTGAGEEIMQTYTRVLQMVETARDELEAGRYTKALGLAHRALTDIVALFAEITSNVASENIVSYQQIMNSYLEYQESVSSRFIFDIISSGYPSIIAIDYYEYALAQKELGATPIVTMEFLSHSISSAIFWKILSFTLYTSTMGPSNETGKETPAQETGTSAQLEDAYPTLLLLLTPAWVLLGYLIAIASIKRRLEEIE